MGKNFRELDAFEQNLAVLFELDPVLEYDKIRKLSEQAVIDYYLTDIHYVAVRRVFSNAEHGLFSDEELCSALGETNAPALDATGIPYSLLTDAEKDRVARDIEQLGTYNELYNTKRKVEVATMLDCFKKGSSKELMKGFFLRDIRKHSALESIGIKGHLGVATLDLKSRSETTEKTKVPTKAIMMIAEYKARFVK